MTPELNRIYAGDCVKTMKTWPDAFVHCAITSPPYWGLRDYGTASWEGGNPDCDHKTGRFERGGLSAKQASNNGSSGDEARGDCERCGAKRIDAQLGLEKTPAEYIANMVEVFREVKRVLRDDGTLWLNIGDSYASGSKGSGGQSDKQDTNAGSLYSDRKFDLDSCGLKAKDLVGIPWMLAFALRADGWYLRQDIIWAKPNPMPESVTDRYTKSHEYIFLLTKSERYFYDSEAIKEQTVGTEYDKTMRPRDRLDGSPHLVDGRKQITAGATLGLGSEMRNKRSIWTVPTVAFADAHFATFPMKLIEPCILAGTSERGVCAACGAPYERELLKTHDTKSAKSDRPYTSGSSGRKLGADYRRQMADNPVRTNGWTATCSCNADVARPIVLDPFMGAGTVALAAATHSRNFIGTELNPEYIKIAERRIAGELAQGKMF
jgi:DNA modification methylase